MKFTREFLLEEAKAFDYAHHVLVSDVLTLFDLHKSALETIENLTRERNRLRMELNALRPPEAKFEVGQIVVRVEGGYAFTIRSRRLDPNGGWLWQYTNSRLLHSAIWSAEKEFRAQTEEEKG